MNDSTSSVIKIAEFESHKRRSEGVQKLLALVDEMRARPTRRQGDLPLPVLAITGPPEAVVAAAQALGRRSLAPQARVDTTVEAPSIPYATVAAQLREAARQLGNTAARGEAPLRFPLLLQVLWLLDLPLPDPHAVRESVGEAIKMRRKRLRPEGSQGWPNFWANVRAYAEGPLPAWAAVAAAFSFFKGPQLGIVTSVLAVAAALVVASLHIAWLSRSWAGRSRYRWFRRQPYVWEDRDRRLDDRDHSFKEFAIRVVETRRKAEVGIGRDEDEDASAHRPQVSRQAAVDAIECLMVNAFLEDLRQGYERRMWKIWRRVTWTRTIYPVLQLDRYSASLARRIEQVRIDTGTPDPLFVVVLLSDLADLVAPQRPHVMVENAASAEDADDVWNRWKRNLVSERSVGSWRIIRIRIDSPHGELLQKDSTRPPRPRRRPLLAGLAVPVILVLLLLAAPLTYVYVTTHGKCAEGIQRVHTGECIGGSNGSFPFHPRLEPIMGRFLSANEDVVNGSRPYVTIIHIGAYSLADGSTSDLLADAQGELTGLGMIQQRLVQNDGDDSKLQLQVLTVNAGDGFRFAAEAARWALDRVRSDPTVIGIVGLNESREEVRQAIRILSRCAVPMISTAATFDDLDMIDGNRVPCFFPLAPSNSYIASQAAYWARKGSPQADIPPATKAVVLIDITDSDLYTKDLGQKFHKRFGATDSTPVEYRGAGSLQSAIEAACPQDKPHPNLVYYAGRSDQFGTFIDLLSDSRCHGITVMAADSVTQYVNDRSQQLGTNSRIRFLYTPLAAPGGMWTHVESQHRTGFAEELDRFLSPVGKDQREQQQPSPEFAALALDASNALMKAAQLAYQSQQGSGSPQASDDLERGGVLWALEKQSPIDGASGLVKLHGAADGRHALNRPLFLVTVNQKGEQVVLDQCGQLFVGQSVGPNCRTES